MRDEAAPVQLGLHVRVRHGLRHSHNWLQLVRFTCVGASGYVINLAVFAASVHLLAIDYRLAAGLAFMVAVTNNFLLNRHWTFDARDGHAGFQAARFFTVSLAAFAFNLLFLLVLVDGFHAAKVPAQAAAIVIATPVSFLGNKLWSFRR
jgi:dolichol-phosphate mannosyltransferase